MKKSKNSNNAIYQEQKSGVSLKRVGIATGALFLALCTFAAGWLGSYFSDGAQERALMGMIRTVEENYREEVDREELFDKLYDALEMDEFCTHYTAEEYAEKLRASEGTNEGAGLSFYTGDGALRIFRVVGNSPAELAGLRRGMYVFSCDGEETNASGIAEKLLQAEGYVTLRCGMRADGGDARDYRVRREVYRAAYCSYLDAGAAFCFRGEETPALTETGEGYSALPADAAYIRIDSFDGNVASEFAECLSLMKARGRKHLVLDLRSDGGGYLSDLCSVASHLLRRAEGTHPLVAQARYRSGKVTDHRAAGNDFSDFFAEDSRILVLADERTASASEALIGALIDYGTCSFADIFVRAETGRTYGKGVMQSHFTSSDGNVLQLTVADIVWPSGRNIHRVGVRTADGATGVEAPLLWGEEDAMLEAACARLKG